MRKLRQLGALLLVLVCIAWVVLTARWLRYDAESFRKMVFGLLPELSFEAGAAHRGCRLPAFVPPEAFVVGQYSNYSQHFAQQQTVTSAFPVEHSDALELLQPLVMAASLRNGYRYAFGTSKHHGASIPAQLVREDRMLCRRANGDWGIMLSGAKQLVSANVDANAAAVLGVPLVNAHEISAAGLGAVRTALQRAGAEHLAAGALAGVMGTPTHVAMWTDPWAPKEASNDEWGRVLTGVPWGCAGLPSEDPSCLRAYLQAAQDAVKNIVTASLRGSTHGAAPVGGGAQWGANHAGTVYGWDAGGACAACLLQHAASGVFFMWQPSWIRVPSLRGRPVGLLSHWACRWHRGNEDSLQCGLPVETPGEGKSGGDVVSCNGLECVEVLNRTAFIQDSLMGFHHTHKIFHYFTAAVGIMHDLSSAPERDLLSTSVGEAEYVDTSPVALQPQFSRAGVLRMDWPKTARLTCVRSSVVGVAGLCPNGYCETALLAAGRDIMAAHVRRRLGVPPLHPLPTASSTTWCCCSVQLEPAPSSTRPSCWIYCRHSRGCRCESWPLRAPTSSSKWRPLGTSACWWRHMGMQWGICCGCRMALQSWRHLVTALRRASFRVRRRTWVFPGASSTAIRTCASSP